MIDVLAEQLPEYTFFESCVNVADYGVPQTRHRALIVGVRQDQPWLAAINDRQLLPWPDATHGDSPCEGKRDWLTLRKWLKAMQYPPLSSQSSDAAKNGDPLHFVPHYDADRYALVSNIPPHSGRKRL